VPFTFGAGARPAHARARLARRLLWIKAELPEVKKEDVKVSVDNGVLRIEGERRQEQEEKGKRFHRVERSYGSFLRTFTLPDNVDEAHVRADFKDGILCVRLQKSEKAKPKSIEVKVA
jgi:HSP20 family protein